MCIYDVMFYDEWNKFEFEFQFNLAIGDALFVTEWSPLGPSAMSSLNPCKKTILVFFEWQLRAENLKSLISNNKIENKYSKTIIGMIILSKSE